MAAWKPYKSYNFKDKDPIIDQMRTMVQDSGMSYRDIHDASGVSVSCLNQWFNGVTRRPTYAAVVAVIAVLGYRSILVERDHKVVKMDHRGRA